MPTGLSLPKTLQFCGDGRRPIKHASVRFPSLLTLLAPLAGVLSNTSEFGLFHGPQTQCWRGRYFVPASIRFRRRGAHLDRPKDRCSSLGMRRLLDKLIQGAPAYDVKVERDGFTLIGKPDHIDEFSDIVREAAEQAGEEFVVFTTSDGHQGYSQMFVMPLDAVDAR